MIEEMIARVFATRNAVHLTHWRVTSGFRHETLGDFYGALIEGIDEIVECYQGAFGLINSVAVNVQPVVTNDITTHIVDEMNWMLANREAIANGNFALLALIDDFAAQYQRTVYKLQYLA